jgi:hypothetical protein
VAPFERYVRSDWMVKRKKMKRRIGLSIFTAAAALALAGFLCSFGAGDTSPTNAPPAATTPPPSATPLVPTETPGATDTPSGGGGSASATATSAPTTGAETAEATEVADVTTVPPEPPAPFDSQIGPVYLIASYYNAIALGDYARAYDYWHQAPPDAPTLDDFASGFADVETVRALARLPVSEDAGAGSVRAEVPVVVLTTLADGESQIFAGCFRALRVNVPVGDATQPDPNWYLEAADLAPASAVDFAPAVAACNVAESFPTTQHIEDRLNPVGLIQAYYDAIAAGDYARAYGYWPNGAPDQTLDEFAAGFEGTSDIGVVVALNFHVGAAAGSTYAEAPLLLTGTESGVTKWYVGCIVTRRSNVPVGDATEPDPNWNMYSAEFNPVDSVDAGLAQIWTACPNE